MRASKYLSSITLGSMMLAMSLTSSQAQTFDTNADTAAALSLGASWVGGVPANSGNIAVWNSTVQVNNTKTLGAALSWAGIKVVDPALSIAIPPDGNALTLGTSGIDLSHATNGLTLGCPIVLNGSQTWMVTNGITLTVTGIVSGAGSTLTLNNGGNNNGLIIITNVNTYSGGTVINSGSVEPNGVSAFGTGAVTNNGGILELIGFPHAGIMVNSFFVTGTSLIDMGNVNASFVLDGPWSGAGTIQVTNFTASGSTLTFGGASGGNMANFTGNIVVVDNASATPSAGALRFNNGGSQANTGNSSMSINLGGTSVGSPGSTIILENRDAGTTSVGELSGGAGTAVTGQTSGNGTEVWSIGGRGTSTTFGGTFKNQGSAALTALTKVGAGTFTLTGTNTATSTTTISAGTLQMGDGNADGTLLAGPVINNSALVFNRSDSYIVANNISGGGSITIQAGGTNNYTGTNSSSGILTIKQGNLVLDASGLLSCPIFVSSGGTFDVSQNPTFTLNQTLSGSGTVTGLLTAASGTISPGGVNASGTLTFLSGLTENGGINNQMELSTPTGTNDLMAVTGNLTLSGVNNIQLSAFGGGTIPSGVYPLITYTGTLTGGPANFAVTAIGVSGTVTNITTTTPPEIAVIIAAAGRGATNLTWKGDGSLNNWDTTSSNWFNGPTSFAFQAGDQVLFSDAGSPNTNVNLGIAVLPASVTFSNTLHYTVSGSGNIGGSGGLTKTNSGTATILTTNSYTGPTIVGQGVLEVGNVNVSGANSSIGAASGNPTNLVFYGSTLKYSGPSATTDRGATLNGAGLTLDVTNGSTLTLNGNITGTGALALTDTGTLLLGNPNTYTGGTIISNGTVSLGSNNANNNGTGGSGVGPTNEPVTFDGGTLRLFGTSTGNNYNTFYNPLVVPAGQTGTLIMFPRGPINTGNGAGLNSPLSGGGTLTLEANYVRDALSGDWSAFTGTILVTNLNSAGGDEFRINNNFGYANATIDLVGNVIMDSTLSANATINIGELDGTTNSFIGPGNASEPGPTWVIGWKNTSSYYPSLIEDDNTAPGGRTSLTKVGTGTLTLVGGTETTVVGIVSTTLATNFLQYSGSTTISNGTLAIIVPDALSLNSNVTLAASSAILDASQMGYVDPTSGLPVTNSVFEIVSGQVLAGLGTIRGFLVTDAGSTFNVGLPASTGVMTVTNAVTLNGTTALKLNASGSPTSDELVSQASITNGGALVVTDIGGGLPGGTTYKLFNAASYVGTFSSVTLPTLDAGQTWNTANLYVNGTISVVGSGTPPRFSSIITSGNNIVLNATNGSPTGSVSVLATTNLLLPLAQWSTLTTGNFDNSGNFAYTNTGALTSGKPQQFFILQLH